MLVIDSGEPETVTDAFDEKGIPYIQEEIKFWYCKKCKKVFTEESYCCGEVEKDRVADFTNTERSFIVERKTEADFVGSTLDYSLHDQARRMAMYFKGPKFVFLEGFISVMLDNPHLRKIKPWLKSMRVELTKYHVCMWQMDDIYMIIRELVALDEECGKLPQIHAKIDDKYSGWTDQKKIVCKLKNVSSKKADIILKHFGGPMQVFLAILNTTVTYTKTGNPKGISGPFEGIKGFGHKFITTNKRMLLSEV